MRMAAFSALDWLYDILAVARMAVLILPDIFQLVRLYPHVFRDRRFRHAIGWAMIREGRRVGAGDIVEAGEALVGDEVPDGVFE